MLKTFAAGDWRAMLRPSSHPAAAAAGLLLRRITERSAAVRPPHPSLGRARVCLK